MTTIKKSFSPLKPSDRIQSLDIMRGIVLLGILLMNINGMGLAGSYGDPTVSGGATGWNLTTWITTELFFSGTMRALFSLLFGVGMFIFLDRLEKKKAGINAANIYFRRLLWLLVFGLIHGYLLLWTGDILYDYALMGFIVFSFRKLPPIKLTLVALLLFSIGALWSYADYKNDIKFVEDLELVKNYKLEGTTVSKELQGVDMKWEKREWKRSPEGIAEYNANMRKGYLDVVAFLAPENQRTDTMNPYRFQLWDVLSMMLLGIALFKWKVLSAEKSYKFYGIITLLGYLIGLSVNYYEIQSIMESNFSPLNFSKSYITYDLGRVPVAIGHVGAIMLFCKLPVLKWLKSSLAAVGKMALTNYIMHSVFAMFIFTGAGFGLFGTFQRFELLYIVFGIWIFQLFLSPIWLKYYQYGPLEWMWRNLSYLKKHPFKK
ncbi:hypothetical protein CW736_11780 [Nonlabens sp. MB-3u-79]|jgi:uncharacterized protein|uniref:DUF418 domain-containing protein n=1 Tax=Nonlabens sp. MB-3u-79 TaxID=2058134 RepID=UPI000C3079DC|nr:DUF418 domain-containing protein [Nonlabens sp. MB-3u-79]AUC80004.1 hypothetical protein CW736_11780 [Nonlabens sp. MB-3u-79]|tara:strand:+ start:1378 stop:2673 length:1296 start_codon:yes stop_codon:yes gene_type:complete